MSDLPERVSREEVYAGRIVRLCLDTVRFPGGRSGTVELIRHAGAAAVVPFLDPPSDPDPRIALIRQYRYPASGHLCEVPAGMPDGPEESWEACARRELLEETGFRAGELRYLTGVFTTPGFTDEVIHLFAALNLRAGSTNRDEDELIEVEPVLLSKAIERVRTGEIRDAKTVSGLLYVASFPDALERTERVPPGR